MIYFARYIILHSSFSVAGGNTQDTTHQHTMVHPMVCCQAAAGLHLLKGAHCTPVFSSSQLQADSNHDCRGYLRCLPVVGVKAFHHGSYELACKREVRCLDAVGIPSITFTFSGTVGGHYCATGSTGGSLHSLVQVAGLSAHRLRAASWSLIFFFELVVS